MVTSLQFNQFSLVHKRKCCFEGGDFPLAGQIVAQFTATTCLHEFNHLASLVDFSFEVCLHSSSCFWLEQSKPSTCPTCSAFWLLLVLFFNNKTMIVMFHRLVQRLDLQVIVIHFCVLSTIGVGLFSQMRRVLPTCGTRRTAVWTARSGDRSCGGWSRDPTSWSVSCPLCKAENLRGKNYLTGPH